MDGTVDEATDDKGPLLQFSIDCYHSKEHLLETSQSTQSTQPPTPTPIRDILEWPDPRELWPAPPNRIDWIQSPMC